MGGDGEEGGVVPIAIDEFADDSELAGQDFSCFALGGEFVLKILGMAERLEFWVVDKDWRGGAGVEGVVEELGVVFAVGVAEFVEDVG